MKLEKRVALITGAAMGIGKAIAMEFMREGANTVVTDINDEMAQKTVHEMNALNGLEAIAIQMDVTDFAFGGFEQFRYDPLDINKFPPKYFYYYGRQYYLNIGFRF